jgi:hypothetical protein
VLCSSQRFALSLSSLTVCSDTSLVKKSEAAGIKGHEKTLNKRSISYCQTHIFSCYVCVSLSLTCACLSFSRVSPSRTHFTHLLLPSFASKDFTPTMTPNWSGPGEMKSYSAAASEADGCGMMSRCSLQKYYPPQTMLGILFTCLLSLDIDLLSFHVPLNLILG